MSDSAERAVFDAAVDLAIAVKAPSVPGQTRSEIDATSDAMARLLKAVDDWAKDIIQQSEKAKGIIQKSEEAA